MRTSIETTRAGGFGGAFDRSGEGNAPGKADREEAPVAHLQEAAAFGHLANQDAASRTRLLHNWKQPIRAKEQTFSHCVIKTNITKELWHGNELRRTPSPAALLSIRVAGLRRHAFTLSYLAPQSAFERGETAKCMQRPRPALT
jgi:hypothetical protein